MGRTIRTCKLACAIVLFPIAAQAADSDADVELYWQAQRADLGGQPAVALKSYDKLLAKFPQSSVAVDRLFDTAVLHGDFAAALKAARAQQLSGDGTAAAPLMFYVDAWRRKDWAEAARATKMLDEGAFAFVVPILDGWVAVAKNGSGGMSDAARRENGTTAYYSDDQSIYFNLANGNLDSAKKQLSAFPGYGDDYARHMGLSAVEHLGRNGQVAFAQSLLQHLGLEATVPPAKTAAFPSEQAVAALFARLSMQLREQRATDQALYFARLAQWTAPDSAFARMTLAEQLEEAGQSAQAQALLSGVAETRPQWSWAQGDRARLLASQGDETGALQLVRAALAKKPDAADLKLMEAQYLAEKGDNAGAATIYRELIKQADTVNAKNGRRVTFRMLLAQALEAQGDWPQGKAALEEALAINDQNPLILNSLGYGLLSRREDMKRGFELVSRAHRLAPQSPAITDSLGWGYYLTGEYEAAIPLLERAVEDAINDVEINEHLGDAYWRAGRLTEARYAWRAAALQADGERATRIATKIDLGWSEATAAP